MMIFALFSIPAAGVFLFYYYVGATHVERLSFHSPILRSAVAFIVPGFVLVLAHFARAPQFVPGALFFRSFLVENLIWTAAGTIFSLSVVRRVRGSGFRLVLGAGIVFWAGLLFLAAVEETIIRGTPATSYEVFFRPIVRLSMLVLFPYVVALTETVTRGGWSLFALLAVPAIAAAVSTLSSLNRPVWAGILAGSVLVASWAVLHFTADRFDTRRGETQLASANDAP